MAHEDFFRTEDIRPGSERSFGLVFCALFAVISCLQLFSPSGSPAIWSVVAGAFLIVSLAAPRLLHPLNLAWFRFGLLLHRIVPSFILGLMYFFVITPLGQLMRLFGQRPLHLGRDPVCTTYWIERASDRTPADSFKNQF